MVGEFKGVETLTGNLFPPSGQKTKNKKQTNRLTQEYSY